MKLHEQELAAKARHEQLKEQLEFHKAEMEQKLQHKLKMEKTRTEHDRKRNTNVVPIPKFSYLKELVDPRVRSSIDGLPCILYQRLRACQKHRNTEKPARL